MRRLTLKPIMSGGSLLVAALVLAVACIALPLAAEELVGTPVEPGAPVPVVPVPPEAQAALAGQAQAQAAQAQALVQEEMARNQQWQGELERNFGGGEFGGGHFAGEGHSFDYSQLVPITAIIFIFGGPIFLFAFWIAYSYRARARRQQDINNNIDKLLAAGRDIPIELLRGDEPKLADDDDNLTKGIRNTFLGIGLLIFLTALVGFDVGALGFILIALGLSRLCVWYLSKPKADAQQQAGSQD